MDAAIHIRWMITRDMPEVLRIERDAFEFPWSEDDFQQEQRRKNVIGMVAEDREGRVVGYMLYELHKFRIHISDFAVSGNFRRRGIGSAMVAKLVGKLSVERRTRIMLEVRETNLDAQLFFRAMGFRAIAVLPDFYDDTPDAAYVMQFRVPSEVRK